MNICLAGYGIIGKAWATHYSQDGHHLTVWNRTPHKDIPSWKSSWKEAAGNAEVLHIVVADPPAVESVLDGALKELPSGSLVIQSSTISPRWGNLFAKRCMDAGMAYTEAPFTGSKIAAEQRKNVFFLGGTAANKERAISMLGPLSSKIFDMGSPGEACTIKLAMNLQIACIAQALSESLTMARNAGIPDDLYFDVLHHNVSRSGLSDLKEPKLLAGDYSPQFSVKHMHKDLLLALNTRGKEGLPLTESVRQVYEQGLASGWGEDDFISLIRCLEDQGGH